MTYANDNGRSYVQATLVLNYPTREEHREVFAASILRMQELAEKIYEAKPELLAVTLWFEETGHAMIFNGPRR